MKQDLEEAKSTVSKRIEYIAAEVKRQESSISELQKQQETHKSKLETLQSQLAGAEQSMKSLDAKLKA